MSFLELGSPLKFFIFNDKTKENISGKIVKLNAKLWYRYKDFDGLREMNKWVDQKKKNEVPKFKGLWGCQMNRLARNIRGLNLKEIFNEETGKTRTSETLEV